MCNEGDTLFSAFPGASGWKFTLPMRSCNWLQRNQSISFFLLLSLSLSLSLTPCMVLKNIPGSLGGQKAACCVCSDCELSSLRWRRALGPPAIVLGVCDCMTHALVDLSACAAASQPVSQPVSLLQVAAVDGHGDVSSVPTGCCTLLDSPSSYCSSLSPSFSPFLLFSSRSHMSLCSNPNTGPVMAQCHGAPTL